MGTDSKSMSWGNIVIPALISIVVAVITTKMTNDGQLEVVKKEIKKDLDIANLTFAQETVSKLIDKEENISELRKKLIFYLESGIIQDTSQKIKKASEVLIDETVALGKFMDGYDLIEKTEGMRSKNCSLDLINDQYKNALKLLTESIELNPFNGQAYISRNICYRQLGLQYSSEPFFYLRALDDSRKALKYYGKPSFPLYYIGRNHRSLGQSDSCLIYYNKAIEENSTIGRYYFSRGVVKMEVDSTKQDTLSIIDDLERSLFLGNITESQKSEADSFLKQLKK